MELPSDRGLILRGEIDTALQAWLGSGGQLLHLVGPPGCGKTCWVKTVVDRARLHDVEGALLAEVAAHHFCRWNDASTASAVAFLEHLINQFGAFDLRFSEAFAKRAGRRRGIQLQTHQDLRGASVGHAVGMQIHQFIVRDLAVSDILDDLRVALSETLADDGSNWLILVDAPDEPAEAGVADLLGSLGQLPRRLRVVVTSRPNVPFERRLQAIGASHRDLSALSIDSPSLAEFVRARATACGLGARLIPGLSFEEFHSCIVKRVKDNFLVARCAIDALSSLKGPLDHSSINALPGDLPEFYRDSLDRLPRELRQSWSTECGQLLGTLAVARAPLNESQLAEIARLPASIVRDRLTRLHAYLLSEGRGYRIFHATFAEFLLDGEVASEYWCPETEQHHRLIEWATASDDWEKAPTYGLVHFVGHVVAAGSPNMLAQLDRALESTFVHARLARGETAHSLILDFKRSLRVMSERGEVKTTLFLTMLIALWHDRAAQSAAPSSTILLAATGHVEEAALLALRQDAAGHSDDFASSYRRTEFAKRLVAINEADVAIRFARSASDEGDRSPLSGVLDALAVNAPHRALLLLREPPFNGNVPTMSPEACRGLASIASGVPIAIRAAGDALGLVAVAEGCACHDLDAAIDLVRDARHYPVWIGGERLSLHPAHALVRVLLAFVQAHPDRSSEAWEKAQAIGLEEWPEPYGFLLAARIAGSEPRLGLQALAKLRLPEYGVHRMLAATWIGAQCEPNSHDLVKSVPSYEATGDKEMDELHLDLAILGLGGVLQMLALMSPESVDHGSVAFDYLRRIGDILLLALSREPDVPERKGRSARDLGRFVGWLGKPYVDRLLSHGDAKWCNESWRTDFGEGVAISLAHRGADAYLAARDEYFSEVWSRHALLLAGEIIAHRDPLEAFRLIDNLHDCPSEWRLELIGITAVVMRQTGKGSLADLQSRLMAYTESEDFRITSAVLQRALDNGDDNVESSEISNALERVNTAILTGNWPALVQAMPAVERLGRHIGQPIKGEIVWADDIRRRLAASLEKIAPKFAMQLLLPVAHAEKFCELVGKILESPDFSSSPAELAEIIGDIVRNARANSGKSFPSRDIALGATLAISDHWRLEFLEHLYGKRAEESIESVMLAVEILEDPMVSIQNISGRRSSNFSPWHVCLALSEIARRDPDSAFMELKQLDIEDALVEIGLGNMASSWPIDRWDQAIRDCLRWANETGYRSHSAMPTRDFLNAILSRVAEHDPIMAIRALRDLLPQESLEDHEGSFSLKNLVVAAASSRPPNPGFWPFLVETARHISESTHRTTALMDLLSAVRHMPNEAIARCTALTIGALGDGPREPVLRNLKDVALIATMADPKLSGCGVQFVARLKSLLSTSPACYVAMG